MGGKGKGGWYQGSGKGKGGKGKGGKGKGKGKEPSGPRVMSWTRAGAEGAPDPPPIVAHKQTVLEAIAAHGTIIISGETGCGKSTQVPQFLLDESPAHRIVVTQPRRLAARALAERVSVERGSALGRTVGYAVSRDKVTTMGTTRLTFMTVGLLLQLLVFRSKEVLKNYTHIVVDEAHERDVDLDLLLLLLRRQLRKQHAAAAAAAAAAVSAAAPPADEQLSVELHATEASSDGPDVAAPAAAPAAAPVVVGLRVIIMSASIDAAAFASYFGGCSLASIRPPAAALDAAAASTDALEAAVAAAEAAEAAAELAAALPPVLNVGSRKQPVGCYTLEQLQASLAAAAPPSVTVEAGNQGSGSGAARLHPSMYSLLEFLLRQLVDGTLLSELPECPEGVDPAGGVLVFLPGVAEIQEALKALKRGGLGADAGLQLLPLHSLQEAEEQNLALQKPRGGMRKVILATNIAESSITVPDVAVVVDFGFEKLPFYNARANTDALLLRRCSVASATQRAGRAGRVSPGVCLRLYPSSFMADEQVMPAFTPAEMQRTSLANLILKVKMIDPLGAPAALLREAIAPPPQTRVDEAVASLVRLGAMTGGGGDAPQRVTSIGKLVAALPVSVAVGRLLLLGEALGCGRQAAVLGALLSLPDPFLQRYTKGEGKDAGAGADPVAEARAAAEDLGFFAPRLQQFLKRGCSDPLASLQLFDEWQHTLSEAGSAAAAKYAHSQHASYKRLAEVEHLSRELTQKVRQQRVENGISLPAAGHLPATGPSLLVLQAMLTAAFSPNLARGNAACPTRVIDEIARNRLEPRCTVYFVVAQDKDSAAGVHLTQEHLTAALAPCGELKQALISKARVSNPHGGATLQTSALLSFASPTAALHALRMAGMKGNLTVPLTDAAGAPAGTARLQAPQYAPKLSFERGSAALDLDEEVTPLAAAEAENAAARAACAQSLSAAGISFGGGGGAASLQPTMEVSMNWHSGAAVLSDDTGEAPVGQRYLLATAWSRAGKRLVAQQASLLPARPHGAAELLLLALSRNVWLAPAVGGGAAGAHIGDGDVGLGFVLPWLLTREAVEEINALRRALSGCLGAHPRDQGESGASLQLQLMRIVVAERPPLSEMQAAAAAAAAAVPPPCAEAEGAELLPPLLLPAAVQAAGGGEEEQLPEAREGREAAEDEPPAKRQAVGSGLDAMEGDDNLELFDG